MTGRVFLNTPASGRRQLPLRRHSATSTRGLHFAREAHRGYLQRDTETATVAAASPSEPWGLSQMALVLAAFLTLQVDTKQEDGLRVAGKQRKRACRPARNLAFIQK